MELRSFGLKSCKFGDIPDDGSMGTVLAAVGQTYKDSASLKEADGTVTQVFSEEEDFAVDEFEETGAVLLMLSIMDYTPEVLQKLKGGVILGGGWAMPSVVVRIEQSIQIITKRDLLIEIPRARVRATIQLDLAKNKVSQIAIKAPVLQPTFNGLAPLFIGPYKAPTTDAGAGGAVAVAVHVFNLVGTAAAFRGTIVSTVWTIKSIPVAAANPVMATPNALANAISSLVTVGDYVFTLTATDSNGYSSSDDVTVHVTA